MKKKPTIRDVAARAGVSIATVSKYINSAQRFTPGVERKIRAAVEELEYHSNPLASSMITGKTGSVGVVILDIGNPHFTSLVKGANRVALGQGYNLLFVDTEESQAREDELLEALSRRVDGLIVSTRMDMERARGLADCLKAHGLKKFTRFEVRAPTIAEGERICPAVVLRKDRFDAVVCYNDMVAIGFLGAARSLGVAVPDDISVVGIDNIPFGRFTSPALTTVDTQSEFLGEEGMRLLLRLIEGDTSARGHMKVEPRLVMRASTRER